MKYQTKEAFDKANHFGLGTSNDAYAQYFIGQSYLNALGATKDGVIALHNVLLSLTVEIIGIFTTLARVVDKF